MDRPKHPQVIRSWKGGAHSQARQYEKDLSAEAVEKVAVDHDAVLLQKLRDENKPPPLKLPYATKNALFSSKRISKAYDQLNVHVEEHRC